MSRGSLSNDARACSAALRVGKVHGSGARLAVAGAVGGARELGGGSRRLGATSRAHGRHGSSARGGGSTGDARALTAAALGDDVHGRRARLAAKRSRECVSKYSRHEQGSSRKTEAVQQNGQSVFSSTRLSSRRLDSLARAVGWAHKRLFGGLFRGLDLIPGLGAKRATGAGLASGGDVRAAGRQANGETNDTKLGRMISEHVQTSPNQGALTIRSCRAAQAYRRYRRIQSRLQSRRCHCIKHKKMSHTFTNASSRVTQARHSSR